MERRRPCAFTHVIAVMPLSQMSLSFSSLALWNFSEVKSHKPSPPYPHLLAVVATPSGLSRDLTCVSPTFNGSEIARASHHGSSAHVRVASFLSGDATVTIAHRCTPKEQLKELTRLADIIVAAAGKYI